jgi:hypothetical protein
MRQEHADKAVRAPEKSSRRTLILTYCSAKKINHKEETFLREFRKFALIGVIRVKTLFCISEGTPVSSPACSVSPPREAESLLRGPFVFDSMLNVGC